MKIWMVLCNSGDGSNHVQWVKDPAVLEKMQEQADDGNETYASGDGLQDRALEFPDDFDIDAWMKINYLTFKEEADLW